ncbi:acetoacetate--CoA ligase [Ostreibacterium oceani]|uniref:Acetoacetate--CoA ligase n=1 Tax=Ostreibacterium oceani TaxID=2654998 RepID=A0A6N7EZY9_9GAMM|nr:acetoacetate--CoA ligase [Ostreibacterium oceani]MPV86707.1 acetoacetate--CoA ligase [Ostreibacterium oceani]
MQLWSPSAETIDAAQSTQFIKAINKKYEVNITDFHQLYDWSIRNDLDFWSECWDFCGVIGDKGGRVISDADAFYHRRFFPDGRLNFAEHFLQNRSEDIAIIFRGEDQVEKTMTFATLYRQVAQLRQFLIAQGVGKGDCVAGVLPNMPETVVAMLATTSLGAIWSSCSPDFGEQGLLDRFGQIAPKVLFVVNGYYYNGKSFDCREKFAAVVAALPSVKQTVVVEYAGDNTALGGARYLTFASALAEYQADTIEFERFSFNHPVYILFSSGTTGKPKCIVHCAGGVLLQHLKELKLHADVKSGERLFYFTTCGWMMWNWLVSGLAAGATLCLYDGSPFIDQGKVLFDYIDKANINHFGVSAKYIDALNKIDFSPEDHYHLGSLRSILSTGSPLSGHSFDYVYDKIKTEVCLSSISGGTDIVSCFVLGSPTLPVYRGEIQTRGLGLAVDAFDDAGHPVRSANNADNASNADNAKGELVCKKPFPCMPIRFWQDVGDEKYHEAYFSRFNGVWCHGDFVEITVHHGLVFHGRSDSILNPGGVRIGTAEIYRQVEKVANVVDSVVIGQQYEDDIRVVLFVQLCDGEKLSDALINEIKQTIRQNTTPRHVPAVILQVDAIPKTKSGKVVEIAVRDVVHGQPINNLTALANPEALDAFKNRPELA